jgi:hypothetical protein
MKVSEMRAGDTWNIAGKARTVKNVEINGDRALVTFEEGDDWEGYAVKEVDAQRGDASA